MNEDHDWNQLEAAWKEEPPASSSDGSYMGKVKSDLRLAAGRTWLISLVACSTMAVITSLCMFHRSVQSYTFTVIAWSAFFSFGHYLWSTRESANDLAVETTTALRTRSKKLARGAQLLDFGRSLIGVETLICLGFWIALHCRERSQIFSVGAGIVLGGFLFYSGLSWVLVRTRRELNGLESIAEALHGNE